MNILRRDVQSWRRVYRHVHNNYIEKVKKKRANKNRIMKERKHNIVYYMTQLG